jgi:putative spermidine/putrescine transport system ATP-binding protein
VLQGGRIEQIGTPSEMYAAPATPFVAEFIGTMNRLEATILDGAQGDVDHGGVVLRLAEARGLTRGQRVLVLVRPELLQLTAPLNGHVPPNVVAGEVLTQTFLGPVTRLKVVGPGANLIADLPTAKAEALPVGSRVFAHVPDVGARLLHLSEAPVP